MIDNVSLKYLIHEEIFIIKEIAPAKLETTKKVISEKQEEELVTEDSKAAENQKTHHDLVVLFEENQTSADKEMLGKLIPAIGKKYSEAKFILSEDWDLISYNFLIAFGDFNLKGLPPLTINEPKTINNVSIIRTISIKKLHTDRQAKGQFWLGLKEMFKIS